MQQYEGQIVYDPQGRPHKIVNGQPVPVGAAPEASPGLQQIVAPRPKAPTPQTAEQLAQDRNQVVSGQLGIQRTQQDIGLDRSKFIADLAKQHDSDVAVLRYRNSIDRAMSALTAGKTPQDDQSIIYAWAKVMDPAGAVQQGDVDLATMTGSLGDRARQYLNMATTGKGLPEGVRKGLITNIRNQVSNYRKSYSQSRSRFEAIAKNAGVEPELVLGGDAGEPFRKDEMAWLEQQKGGGAVAKTPEELNQLITELVDKQAPVSEIRALIKRSNSTLPPYQEKILDSYEAARAKGDRATVVPRTLPGGDVGMGLAKGLLHPLDRAAAGVEKGINAATGWGLDDASMVQQARNAYFSGQNVDPTAETFGKIASAGVLTAPFGGAFTQGALGNVLAGDAQNAGDVATDAVIGGVGGKVADKALRGVASLIAPQVDPAVQRLSQQGVKLRPGRMFGGSAPLREDLLRSYPVVGPKIDQLAERELATLSKVQPNRALGQIGQSVPDNVAPGHETVRYAKDAISNAYDGALSGAQVGLDPTFFTRLNAFGKRSNMRPQEFNEFDEILQREVGGAFTNGKGVLSGRDFKRLDEKLGQLSTGFNKMDDPYKRQIGDAIGFTNEQMRALARRQNPQMANDLRAADRAFSEFVPFERAAAMAPDGIPTPGQMRTASRANDNSRRKGLTARGEAKMQDLAEDAARIIPSERGNSGTADRLNQTDWKAWALGSVASPLYSQPVIDVVEKLALRSPGLASQRAADFIRSRALPRGMFGAALPAYFGSGN